MDTLMTSTRPLVIKEHPGEAQKTMSLVASKASHFCAIDAISDIHGDNLHPHKKFVDEYFQKVKQYNQYQSSFSSQLTSANKSQRLEKAKFDLEKVLYDESSTLAKKNTLLEHAADALQEEELTIKLETVKTKQIEMFKLISETDELLNQHNLEALMLKVRLLSVTKTPKLWT
ncbi:unnamed protein product [Citrullus colocynthis]|uniref:DUF641 domain-containing protein n=1 Tax=Citrullus colocynthis TaxID=252529 RepID=A0ABP0Y791_9ROSI